MQRSVKISRQIRCLAVQRMPDTKGRDLSLTSEDSRKCTDISYISAVHSYMNGPVSREENQIHKCLLVAQMLIHRLNY